jgi:glycerophosphoryl diester phosphodiesterase
MSKRSSYHSFFAVIGLAGVLAGGSVFANDDMSAKPLSPAEALIELSRPLVIAHRGYSQFAPENTLPAFQLGLRAGADLVELDYHHTKDGVPIVIHDADLDRTTDATNRWGGSKLNVTAYTAAELQALDAGTWFSPNFTGTKLPTLAEAVAHIQKFPGASR